MARALITGASSGVGEEFCYRLARRGWDLVMVARREPLMKRIARVIHQHHNVDVEILTADLSCDAGIDAVAERLKDSDNPVDLFVSNAGFATGQFFLDGQLDYELDNLKVMVEAPMRLSYAAVNAMRARGYGGVIFVGSYAANKAMGTYASHKTWLQVFSESLRLDVKGTGVKVSYVAPGTIMTDFWNSMHTKPSSPFHHLTAISKKRVVRVALRNWKINRPVAIPGFMYKFLHMTNKLVPRSFVNWISHTINMNRLHM